MSLPVILGGSTVLIVMGTLLYGTQVYVAGSGSALAKYTVKKNATCLSANTTIDQNNSSDYIQCMSELELLVKTLINNSEIVLLDCELDGNNATVAYCPVVTWYRPSTVVVTDSDSVTAIAEKLNSTMSTAARRKRNADDLFNQVVGENTDDQILETSVKNANLMM